MKILGAHMCGKIRRTISHRIGKVGTIIGLDPAGPLFSSSTVFYKYSDSERLDKSDADYVLALHTDSKHYGMRAAIGHGLYFMLFFFFIKSTNGNH